MVSRSSLIRVRNAYYSVPAYLIGRRVRVSLRASHLVVFDAGRQVARHPRVAGTPGQSIDLDHYLEVLTRKPGALPASCALAAARAQGVFTPAHDAFWDGARKAHGDRDGTLQLIEVLLLHRTMPPAQVIAGIRAATGAGAFTADVVAIEARLAAAVTTGAARGADAKVVSLTARRLGLPADTRRVPSVEAYDDLLPSRRARKETPA
jgi:hypothetical protein